MDAFSRIKEIFNKRKAEWSEEQCKDRVSAQKHINTWNVALAIVDMVEKEHNNGWIPCTDELPPQPQPNSEFEGKALELYLVSTNDSKYPYRAFWNGKDFTDGISKVHPMAWQPLPKQYEVMS